MPRKTKKPAGPPADASLLGIPSELRNTIYHLVAHDIDEASIIGRKLKDNVTWWDTMAKHPLSQTCRQLRQDIDPIHKRRAITLGVAKYRLELEDYDVGAITTFARLAGNMPRAVRNQLKKAVNDYGTIIRFNLTANISASIRKLGNDWRELDSIFSKLRRALGVSEHTIRRAHEVNLNFKNRRMSPALKKVTPTQYLVRAAEKEFKKISEDVSRNYWRFGQNGRSVNVLENLFETLEYTHQRHVRLMRENREERARKALETQLESRLRARLREELKAELKEELKEELKIELRKEIIDELTDDAKVELDRQIQEGLESWTNEAGAESTH